MIKRLLRLVGRWARKPVNHTSWVALVTPTDRPKSVRNRCLIELFCGVVCVVTLPFWHFCWCRGFCHRTESDLFLFLLFSGRIPEHILTSVSLYFVHRCRKMTGRRQVFFDKLALNKVGECRCLKALIDFADFRIFCQVGPLLLQDVINF